MDPQDQGQLATAPTTQGADRRQQMRDRFKKVDDFMADRGREVLAAEETGLDLTGQKAAIRAMWEIGRDHVRGGRDVDKVLAELQRNLPEVQKPGADNRMEQLRHAGLRAKGNVASAMGGAATWLKMESLGQTLADHAATLAPIASLPPETVKELGEFDPAKLGDKDWMMTKGAESIFTSLALMAPMYVAGSAAGVVATGAGLGAVGTTIASVVTGTAVGAPMEALFEAGDAYNSAIAQGGTREQAGAAAHSVWSNNLPALTGSNAAELAISYGILSKIPKSLRGGFTSWLQGSKRAGVALTGMAASGTFEGGQELAQQYYQEAGVEWALGKRPDEPGIIPPLDDVIEMIQTPEGKEAFAMGALTGFGMSAVPATVDASKLIADRLANGEITAHEAMVDMAALKRDLRSLDSEQLQEKALAEQVPLPDGTTDRQAVNAIAVKKRKVMGQGLEAAESPAVPADQVDANTTAAIKELQSAHPRLAEAEIEVVADTPAMAKVRGQVAGITNADVVFVRSPQGYLPANGYITRNHQTILVDANAANTYAQVLGHEITHKLEGEQSDLFAEIADAAMTDKNFSPWLARLNASRAKNDLLPMTASEARSEHAADFVGKFLLDPQFLARVAMRNPGAVAKVEGPMRALMSKLMGRIPQSTPEAKALRATQSKLERVFDKWAGRTNPARARFKAKKAKPENKESVPSRSGGNTKIDAAEGHAAHAMDPNPQFSLRPDERGILDPPTPQMATMKIKQMQALEKALGIRTGGQAGDITMRQWQLNAAMADDPAPDVIKKLVRLDQLYNEWRALNEHTDGYTPRPYRFSLRDSDALDRSYFSALKAAGYKGPSLSIHAQSLLDDELNALREAETAAEAEAVRLRDHIMGLYPKGTPDENMDPALIAEYAAAEDAQFAAHRALADASKKFMANAHAPEPSPAMNDVEAIVYQAAGRAWGVDVESGAPPNRAIQRGIDAMTEQIERLKWRLTPPPPMSKRSDANEALDNKNLAEAKARLAKRIAAAGLPVSGVPGTYTVFHGTPSEFSETAFSPGRGGSNTGAEDARLAHFFAGSESTADSYRDFPWDAKPGIPTTYRLVLHTNNPHVVQMKGRPYSEGVFAGSIKWAKEFGHDAVIFLGAKDGGGPDNIFALLKGHEDQVKSIEPVQHYRPGDPGVGTGGVKAGDIIPPSKRFDPTTPDFRFSLRDVQSFLDGSVGDPKENLRKKFSKQATTGVAKNKELRLEDGEGRPIWIGANKKSGGKAYDAWMEEVDAWLTDAEIHADRQWYRELESEFKKIFGDRAPQMMMAWLAAQQNVSPTGAMKNVFKVEDRLAGIRGDGTKGGLADERIENILSGADEGSMGPKLADFVDAGFGKSTRSFMGDNPKGGQPFVADVHTGRDSGHVDQQTIGRLKKMATAGNLFVDGHPVSVKITKTKAKKVNGKIKIEPHAARLTWQGRRVNIASDMTGSPSDTGYEGIAEWGARLTAHLNAKEFKGGNWVPAEAQAVGWMRVLRQYGLAEPTVADVISQTTATIPAEVNFSSGAELKKLFPTLSNYSPAQQKQLTMAVMEKVAPEIANIVGGSLRMQGVHIGTGYWGGEMSPSVVIRMMGSDNAQMLFMDALAYVSEQAGTLHVAIGKGGKNKRAVFFEKANGKLTPDEIKSLALFAEQRGKRDLEAFSIHELQDGQTGMITRGKGLSEKGAERVVALLATWAKENNVTLVLNDVAATSTMHEHNWKGDPSGRSYLQEIERLGGDSQVRKLDRYRREEYRQILGDEFARLGKPGQFSLRGGAGVGSGQASLGKDESSAPLPGAPQRQGATGPDLNLVKVANDYAAQNGIELRRQAEYVHVDPARARRIADAYDAMPDAPEDPAVQAAYANLIEQTTAQYRALEAAGYEFYFVDPDNADGNPWNAMRELRSAKTMGIYPTESGFGSDASVDTSGNPLLADTGITWRGKPVLANDLFRAVHDAFGHGLEGAGFRARGEENAWQAHVRLFTGSAIGAITSETRGQNSWLNYGPHGEANKTAKVEDTIFADQKTGLMPAWTWEEGISADEQFSLRDTELDVANDRIRAKAMPKNAPRVNRAIPVSDPEARDAFRILDDEREKAGQPTYRGWDEVEAIADKQLRENGVQAELARLKRAPAVSDVDMRIFAKLLEQGAMPALRSQDPAALREWSQLIDKYRDDRADVARSLAIGRDRFETPEQRMAHFLNKAILRPKPELEAAIDDAKAKGDVERQGALWKQHEADLAKLFELLKAAGIDLATLDLSNANAVQEVMRAKKNTVATWGDMLYEYWMNAILSGPKTHAANILGTAYAAYDLVIVDAVEGMLSRGKSKGSADMQEWGHAMKAMRGVWGKAAANARQAWRTEVPVLEPSITGMDPRKAISKLESGFQPGAIAGKKGRFIRTPSRFLLAADEFLKTIYYHMALGKAAYRNARDAGLTGSALQAAVDQAVGDPGSVASKQAMLRAKVLAFQDRGGLEATPFLGGLVRGISQAKQDGGVLGTLAQYLIPFETTPGNLLRYGVTKLTPLGWMTTLAKAHNTKKVEAGLRDNKWTYSNDGEMAHDIAAHVLSTVAMFAILELVAGDDDGEPWITGGGAPFQKRGEKDHEWRNNPPMSIRVRDTWYSYQRIDPMATGLAMMVDLAAAVKRSKNGMERKENLSRLYSAVVTEQLQNKTYLKSIGDIMKAVESPDSFGKSMTINFASSWSPAVLRHAASAGDDTMRKYKPEPGSGLSGMMSTIAQRALPLEGFAPRPKRDPWGRAVTKTDGAMSEVGRFLSPMLSADATTPTQLDRMIQNWADQNPNDAYYVSIPQQSFTVDGERVDWTNAEYDAFLQARGERIVQMWDRVGRMTNYAKPSEQSIKQLKRIVAQADKIERTKAKRAAMARIAD